MRLTLGFSWLALVAATNSSSNASADGGSSNATTTVAPTVTSTVSMTSARAAGAAVKMAMKKFVTVYKGATAGAGGATVGATTAAPSNGSANGTRRLMEVRDLAAADATACGLILTELWVKNAVGRAAMEAAAAAIGGAGFLAYIDPATAVVTADSTSTVKTNGECNGVKIDSIKVYKADGSAVTLATVTEQFTTEKIKAFTTAASNAQAAAIDNIIATPGNDADKKRIAMAMGYPEADAVAAFAAGGPIFQQTALVKAAMADAAWLTANADADYAKANTVVGTDHSATTTTAAVSGANQVAVLLVAAAGAFFALF